MPHNYSDDRLRLAARLYYIDGLGQNEVAKFVKVSQAKVSRLLALARERGIVRISVAEYDPRRRDLEGQLCERFGLATAVVLKAIDGLNTSDLRRAVGHFAASPVDALIKPRDVVAVAGGRTIHELVHHLPEPKNRALTVVQAMGSVDSHVNAFDAQEVGRVLAQRLGGSFLTLNVPAFMPDKRTRDALLQLEQVRVVHQRLGDAAVALVGIGTLENSVFLERGVLTADDVDELAEAGAVGEIGGRFFDAKGNECDTPWRDRAISVEVDQLRRIPLVLGVVSGSDRSDAILAAIRGRLVKGLVIDEAGATVLLAMSSSAAAKTKKRKS
ncbi:MAG TPA: sugar-binding transcriptional regulator [Opitutus sp.]|nr:sugar-binding transcriptional regulator [Opitutus sp.]